MSYSQGTTLDQYGHSDYSELDISMHANLFINEAQLNWVQYYGSFFQTSFDFSVLNMQIKLLEINKVQCLVNSVLSFEVPVSCFVCNWFLLLVSTGSTLNLFLLLSGAFIQPWRARALHFSIEHFMSSTLRSVAQGGSTSFEKGNQPPLKNSVLTRGCDS